MFFSDLLPPIKAFLQATYDRDADDVFATLSEDAVLTDMGQERCGDQIREWNDKLRMVEVKLDLPKPIVAFVNAMNMYDGDTLVAVFTEGALVNDQRREHQGKDAIRRWADKEIIGDKVTMYVTDAVAHAGGHAVTAKVTGSYDKTGLPDPLVLRFYFSLGEGGITQLIVVPITPAAA